MFGPTSELQQQRWPTEWTFPQCGDQGREPAAVHLKESAVLTASERLVFQTVVNADLASFKSPKLSANLSYECHSSITGTGKRQYVAVFLVSTSTVKEKWSSLGGSVI